MLRELTRMLLRGRSDRSTADFGRALAGLMPVVLPVRAISLNIGSIPQNGTLSVTASVAGVAAGDVVGGTSFPDGLPSGVRLVSVGTSANALTFVFSNSTGSPVTPGGTDVHFVLHKFAA